MVCATVRAVCVRVIHMNFNTQTSLNEPNGENRL